MLNEQKIKKMRKLAAYESGKGREDLSISNYYRSDYICLLYTSDAADEL